MNEPPGRFYVRTPADSPADAYTKAFIWLKRRSEERHQAGTMAIAGPHFLDGPLKDALGWRLTDLLKQEGELPLGDGAAIRWANVDSITESGPEPLAVFLTDDMDLGILERWAGVVLLAGTGPAFEAWVAASGALEPPPERFV